MRFVYVVLAMVVLMGGCSSDTATGDLQLIVADQTVENPIRDVVEIRLGDGTTIYPDSAAGGSPTDGGTWAAGDVIELTIWPNAADEPIIPLSLAMPETADPETVSLIVEIEDDAVFARASILALDDSFVRTNPVREQAEAVAEQATAEKAAAEAAEAEEAKAAEEEANLAMMTVRREAAKLNGEMTRMQTELDEVLEEHSTVYGDDDWASFKQIARKYRDYTTDALDDLHESLPYSTFVSVEVVEVNETWQRWWDDYMESQSRSETAARNNDTTTMDAVRVEVNRLWDQWSEMFDAVDALTTYSTGD
jgi:hypothetical protein